MQSQPDPPPRSRLSLPSLLAAGHRARRSALHVDAPLAVRLRHRTARTCQRLLQTLGVDSSSPRDRIRFPLALLCTAVAPLLTGYVRLNSLPTQRPARATLDHTSFLLISISAMTTMIPRFSAHQCRAFSASRATCRYSQRYHPQWRRARRSADCRCVRVCARGRACACGASAQRTMGCAAMSSTRCRTPSLR